MRDIQYWRVRDTFHEVRLSRRGALRSGVPWPWLTKAKLNPGSKAEQNLRPRREES